MEKIRYYNELLYNGFWCFEMMTERNLSEAVCGICGVIGEVYLGDGNEKNCCSNSKVECTHVFTCVSQCLYLATSATLATTSQSVRLSVFVPRNLCNPCNHVSVSPSLSVCTSQPLQPLQPRLSQSVSQCLYIATLATLATTSQSVRLSVFVSRNLCNP